jgi:hypothetical protein
MRGSRGVTALTAETDYIGGLLVILLGIGVVIRVASIRADGCPGLFVSASGRALRRPLFALEAKSSYCELYDMNGVSRFLNCAALGTGILLFAAVDASAAIVCAGKVRWHGHHEYRYRAKPVVVFYADDWRWGRTDQYQWRREHGVRGYVCGNKLIEIER